MKRSFIREILENINPNTISFAGGLPSANLFPLTQLEESSRKVLNDSSSLQYGTSSGYEKLKEKIAQLYTDDGFTTKPSNILITSGSQQALDIISRYYSNSSITIEKPSYLGAMNIFRLNNLDMQSISLNSSFYDKETFDNSIMDTKLAYLIPDFQNPTGFTYNSKQRKEISNTIKKNNAILIEDAPYSKLYFENEFESISKFLPNNSYHLGSFSKILSPGLRIGWIRASEDLLEPLIAYKEAMDLHTSTLGQHILNDYLENNENFNMHKEKIRRVYKKKLQIFTAYLNEILPEFIYEKPKGGMFIYGRLNHVNTSALVQKCLNKGVVFVPGNEFYDNNNNQSEIRFNFTHSTSSQIYNGLKLIKEIIKEGELCKAS